MTAPLTPLNLMPVNGSTVTTSNFMASATLRPWPLRQKLQFEFASNNTFTVNNHTAETAFKNPGAATVSAGLPRLPSGACYVRVRAIEEGSNDASAWSATHALTITHGGNSVLVSPGYGASMPWVAGAVTFDWDFRDNCQFDVQTAYRVRVETNDADSNYATLKLVYATYGGLAAVNDDYNDTANSGGTATLYDSGKITSAATTRAVTLPGGARNELVRWSVQTWDDDDTTAGITSYHPLFVGDLPTVTILAPTSSTDTPNPPVKWTYASAAGHAQERYRVRVLNNTTGSLIFDSGTLTAGPGLYSFDEQYVEVNEYSDAYVDAYGTAGTTSTDQVSTYYFPRAVFTNGVEALLIIDSISTSGMQQTDTQVIMPSWIAPPNPSIEVLATNFDNFGRVDLDWTGAPQDPTFVEWRVYRRATDEADWELLAATQDFQFFDHGAPPLPNVQYSVTQVGVAYGVQVESQQYPIGVDLTSTSYLIKSQIEPGRVLMLENVTSDDFTDEYEREVMQIMGVGRKTEVGTNWGKKGSLGVQFRDFGIEGRASADYAALTEIKDSGDSCWLRIPFRDTLLVSIGDIAVKRIAGVTGELTDVTIEYTEIAN